MEVPAAVYEEMIRHARSAVPAEACGLLAAGPDGKATRAYCLTNLDASPVAYTVDPSEHIGALHDAEGHGWHLAAVFHSHPAGPPVPSATDVAKALEPAWLYVIIGLALPDRPSVRGFRIVDGVVTEEPIAVEAA
ncbi:MAG: M67 family metallopeptidase [Actinobacteria bacterium]|nr:M67 family metallopeptidase [Actinomycetota bacterium]